MATCDVGGKDVAGYVVLDGGIEEVDGYLNGVDDGSWTSGGVVGESEYGEEIACDREGSGWCRFGCR